MKLLKIAFIVSCVLSAVFSRRSKSKSHRSSPAAYQSRIDCSKPDDCKSICINFKIIAKNIECHQPLCQNSKCVCAPAADAKNIGEADKCQYADASTIAPPNQGPNSAAKSAKGRRRRY